MNTSKDEKIKEQKVELNKAELKKRSSTTDPSLQLTPEENQFIDDMVEPFVQRSISPPRSFLNFFNQIVRLVINGWNRIEVFFIRHIYEGIILKRAKERFFLVFGGHIFFQTFHAAVKLDLFSLLSRKPNLTMKEIAAHLGLDEQPTRILLFGLTTIKFLKKKGDRYNNTLLSKELLTKESPKNVIPYVYFEGNIIYKAMPHFSDAIRQFNNVGLKEFEGTEPTLYQRLPHHPELEHIFQDAMQALSIQTNKTLAKFLDLSKTKHLVDIGGGDGTNIITLAHKTPQLNATVFDLPSVCEIARGNILQHRLSHRLHVLPGNCFHQEFPKNADAFLFSHFFTIWSPKKDRLLLKKSYEALPKGGKIILFNMMQNDDGTGPLSAAVGSPYFLTLATGEGMLYTWKEYETWMREAGFTKVKRIPLPRDHGIIIGIK